MLQFEWLWAFALLPLPFLVRLLLPASAANDAALRVPFAKELKATTVTGKHTPLSRVSLWLGVVAWSLLVVALARPQWLGDSIELPVSGRDLMLAVDLSGSMEIQDFVVDDRAVDRLSATKMVAGEFIDRRVGDRLGLILFGRQAYLQTPLTFDRKTVKQLLHESAIGLAGKETAIGDAIGLAVKRLRAAKKKSVFSQRSSDLSDKVLILLTDGANTAGEVHPVKAAELAAAEQLKIYTIGIGADEMVVRSFFGTRTVNPSADLDEKTLKTIAKTTGGRYFRARDTRELEEIYALLDELEPVIQETQSFRPISALYYWPLGLALAIGAILALRRCQA
jgi:Ca-activated chloride channel family protein